MVLAVHLTDISGSSIVVAAGFFITFIGIVAALYKASPIGSDAVETWKHLAEGRKEELEEARADARARFDEAERIKSDLQASRLELARCQEQPKTEELAKAIREMSAGFQTHRGELLATQNRILTNLEKNQETIGSMHQALIVLVDRNRDHRLDDPEGRDPPLST